MKVPVLFLACVLIVSRAPVNARQAINCWFLGGSIGKGLLLSSGEVDDFYSTTFSFSVDLGYKLTRYISIVPISVAGRRYNFDKYKADKHMWGRWSFYKVTIPEPYSFDFWARSTTDIKFKAESLRKEISVTPGLIFSKPVLDRAFVFIRAGAGLYRSKVTLESYAFEVQDFSDLITHSYSFSRSVNEFGVLISGGFEYFILEKVAVNVQGGYDLIFRRNKNFRIYDEGSEIMKAVRLQPDELIGYKNRGLLEVNVGLRYNFAFY